MADIINLFTSDTDDVAEFISEILDTSQEEGFTDLIYIALNEKGESFYGKMVYTTNKPLLIGGLELMKNNLIETY